MREYIATFYNHFGAVRFERELHKMGAPARMMPVPRDLSSSCGTAVKFQREESVFSDFRDEHGEIEQIAEILEKSYRVLWKSQS